MCFSSAFFLFVCLLFFFSLAFYCHGVKCYRKLHTRRSLWTSWQMKAEGKFCVESRMNFSPFRFCLCGTENSDNKQTTKKFSFSIFLSLHRQLALLLRPWHLYVCLCLIHIVSQPKIRFLCARPSGIHSEKCYQ